MALSHRARIARCSRVQTCRLAAEFAATCYFEREGANLCGDRCGHADAVGRPIGEKLGPRLLSAAVVAAERSLRVGVIDDALCRRECVEHRVERMARCGFAFALPLPRPTVDRFAHRYHLMLVIVAWTGCPL